MEHRQTLFLTYHTALNNMGFISNDDIADQEVSQAFIYEKHPETEET